jgi:carbonic anhydrase
VIRNVANLAPPFEQGAGYHGTSAAIEFAVERLKVETILVLGHAQCGGVAHALKLNGEPSTSQSFLDAWVNLLTPAITRLETPHHHVTTTDLEQESIRVTIENLKTFPFVRKAMQERGMRLEGARYGVADGDLEVLDAKTGTFVPVD